MARSTNPSRADSASHRPVLAGTDWLDDFANDTREQGDLAVLWPLLVGAWQRKPAAGA